jgi:isoamylase
MTTIRPGSAYPLGATYDGQGVNFALFSAHATRVELCLFDTATAPRESQRITLPERSDGIWHGYIPGITPGQLYGYRVHGPYKPHEGHRFNPANLLIDPYARAITGDYQWDRALYGYRIGSPYQDLTIGKRDSAPYSPRCVVVDERFDWGDDASPAIPFEESIVYEAHLKGLTKLHPKVPEKLRGTYLGLADPHVIAYLKDLGITAVELLPIHQAVNDQYLEDNGLRNYWGYNTLGFFAPDARFSSGGGAGQQVTEFKQMVKALHAAGIEVLLDVVYNHTGEGNQLGPTLCYRGLDNRSYYKLVTTTPRYYMDYTGCGNSLDLTHPRVNQMVLDSLRYWVTEMHVDGFRFDLARTLVRGTSDETTSPFLDTVLQDPVLAKVKLIAEAWDVGPDGYWVGRFPAPWSEWNGKYRDNVRKFWKGDGGQAAELASRLTGSSDLYRYSGRKPTASVNFVTAHDGFTLRDLVSYNEKHNEANGEGNRDGDTHNNSWNCGVEGPTDDEAINALRAQQQRNFLATLFLSQGVPMLLAGDERSRSQNGNNNTYCQDNALSWNDWSDTPAACELLAFTRELIALRKARPMLRRRNFFVGQVGLPEGEADIEWLSPDGQEMNAALWNDANTRCFGMLLNGMALNEIDTMGEAMEDDVLLVLLNASHTEVPFMLPDWPDDPVWEVLIDTANPGITATPVMHSEVYSLKPRSLALLCRRES